MRFSTIFRYQLGDADAIKEVAHSKSALWVGMFLVLITTIPRNYDQRHITEQPWLWLFGSLGFSLISGYILYEMAYFYPLRRSGVWKRKSTERWRTFMGLFWMTAPSAWLYAIPVERFLEPVAAARANVTLLLIVATWRVILITRAMSLLTRIPFGRQLPCVLGAAALEILLLGVLGLSRHIAKGMMGMRNSPSEDVLIVFANVAVGLAFYSLPVLLIIAHVRGRSTDAIPLPERQPDTLPWRGLLATFAIWVFIAVYPQKEQKHHRDVERLVHAKDYKASLQLMADLGEDAFSPSRPLPPLAFELSVYREVPEFIACMDESTPGWLQDHLLETLDQMWGHLMRWYGDSATVEQTARRITRSHYRIRGEPLHRMLAALQGFPEGRQWLTKNQFILQAIHYAAESKIYYAGKLPPEERKPEQEHWAEVKELVAASFNTTNAPPEFLK